MVNKTRNGRVAVKERDLLDRYGSQEKVEKLKSLLRQKGLWEYDDDFPKDEEEKCSHVQNVSVCPTSFNDPQSN